MTQQYERDKIKEQERMSEVEFDNFTISLKAKNNFLTEINFCLKLTLWYLKVDIVYPPSHSLSQTDREYFNIVKTEDGHSNFKRERDG